MERISTISISGTELSLGENYKVSIGNSSYLNGKAAKIREGNRLVLPVMEIIIR